LEKAEIRADVGSADIIVASVPTLGRKGLNDDSNDRLRGLDPKLFKCIIIDEAHHSAAPSYRRIMEHFGAFREESHLLVWGCSATFRRFDDQPLNLFQKVVYHLDLPVLMREGWLCRAELFQICTELNLDGIRVKDGDFSTEDLSLALNTPNRNFLIAQTWQEEAVKSRGARERL
jgi:ATP-dependent helicase IRC3